MSENPHLQPTRITSTSNILEPRKQKTDSSSHIVSSKSPTWDLAFSWTFDPPRLRPELWGQGCQRRGWRMSRGRWQGIQVWSRVKPGNHRPDLLRLESQVLNATNNMVLVCKIYQNLRINSWEMEIIINYHYGNMMNFNDWTTGGQKDLVHQPYVVKMSRMLGFGGDKNNQGTWKYNYLYGIFRPTTSSSQCIVQGALKNSNFRVMRPWRSKLWISWVTKLAILSQTYNHFRSTAPNGMTLRAAMYNLCSLANKNLNSIVTFKSLPFTCW